MHYAADGTAKKHYTNDTSKPSVLGLFSNQISGCIFPVVSGDYFQLTFTSSAVGTFRFIGRDTNTFLCIEKIC